MAATSLVPKNGAIAYGTYIADFNAFTLRFAQAVEGATPFGANFFTKNVPSGTPGLAYSISACALAHGSGTKPGVDGTGANVFSATGLASTLFTLDTGVTYGMTAVTAEWSVGTARMRAVEPVSISGANYGEVVETYAIS